MCFHLGVLSLTFIKVFRVVALKRLGCNLEGEVALGHGWSQILDVPRGGGFCSCPWGSKTCEDKCFSILLVKHLLHLRKLFPITCSLQFCKNIFQGTWSDKSAFHGGVRLQKTVQHVCMFHLFFVRKKCLIKDILRPEMQKLQYRKVAVR